MTCAEALALLDEAEDLLPGSGKGLPSFDACRRLEEIANAILSDAPMPLDRIMMRAAAIRNAAHRWCTPGRADLGGTAERAKWLIRRDLDDLRNIFRRGSSGLPEHETSGSSWLGEKLGGWLHP